MSGTNWRTRFCLDCGHIDAADAFEFVGPFGPNWQEEGNSERKCPECGTQAPTSDFPVHSSKAYMVAFGPGCATCNARPVGIADDGGPYYPATCHHEPIFATPPRKRHIPDEDHGHSYGRTTKGGWHCVSCGYIPPDNDSVELVKAS